MNLGRVINSFAGYCLRCSRSFKNHYKKHKKRTIFLLVLSFLLLIAFFFLFANLDYLLYEFPRTIAEKTGTALHIFVIEKSNRFFSLLDDLNPFHLNKDLLDGTLPVYNLKLSANDLKHFEELSKASVEKGYLVSSLNTWRDARLDFGDNKYSVKVKFHGDLYNHWAGYLKSYKIKFAEGSINNIKRFDLIIFEDRLLGEKIAGLLAQDLGLFKIRDDIVVLKINGVIQGLYYLGESLDEDLFENNQCSSCLLVQTTDNYIEDHPRAAYPDLNGITDGPGHGTDFDDEIGNLNFDASQAVYGPQVLEAVDDLYQAINNQDIKKVSRYFDLDQLSSFAALWLIVGNSHFIHGDNLRLAYSASLGKFYPIPRVEGLFGLRLENGGLEHALNLDVPLFTLLSHNEQLRHLRNKKVYNYILNNTLLDQMDKLIEKYQPYTLSYRTNDLSRRYIKYVFKKDKETLAKNMEMIKRNLEYAKCYLNLFEKDNKIKIEVIPDSIAQLRFDQLAFDFSEEYSGTITFAYSDENNQTFTRKTLLPNSSKLVDLTALTEGLFFSAGLDEQMYPAKRIYSIEIIFDNAKKIKINNLALKMSNDITAQPIKEDDLYFQLADANDFYPDSSSLSFEEFKSRYPQLSWSYQNNELALLRGNYLLEEDLIIPAFSKFIIEAGTMLSIAEDKAVMSYSSLEIRGTSSSPVIIKAQDTAKPFGTFGFLGDKKGKVIIDWLDLSGGNEKVINGVYFSGALSIYNFAEVEITNSKIHNNHADDGLNIKYAQVKVDNVQFYDNFADQFDCDFCQGLVKDSSFKDMEAGDDNGDGLDFSGSQVLVKNNLFQHFKDKGVSIGEDTKIILFKNLFSQNNLGSAIKDSSHAFFIKNTFNNNNCSLDAYQKKPLFNGGTAYLSGNLFENNNKKYRSDPLSKFYEINFKNDDYSQLVSLLEQEEVDAAFTALEKYGKWD